MRKAALLIACSVIVLLAMYAGRSAVLALSECNSQALGSKKLQLLGLMDRARGNLDSIESKLKNTQRSDPKYLIKQLSQYSYASNRCKRVISHGGWVNKDQCAMYRQAAAYYKGRLNEIATHVPDEDTEPYLHTLRLLQSDYKNQLTRLGNETEAVNNQIESCKSQRNGNGDETRCSSLIGTWNWWNGLTVTFHRGSSTQAGGATYTGSSWGSGSWVHTGGNSYRVHWNTSNTTDLFTMSRDGTKLEGMFDGKPGTSTREC